jgi:hypothetical protein
LLQLAAEFCVRRHRRQPLPYSTSPGLRVVAGRLIGWSRKLDRTRELRRGKEISTDPITGWRYQRTWEETQVRSEREIRQLEELRRINVEGYREGEE